MSSSYSCVRSRKLFLREVVVGSRLLQVHASVLKNAVKSNFSLKLHFITSTSLFSIPSSTRTDLDCNLVKMETSKLRRTMPFLSINMLNSSSPAPKKSRKKRLYPSSCPRPARCHNSPEESTNEVSVVVRQITYCRHCKWYSAARGLQVRWDAQDSDSLLIDDEYEHPSGIIVRQSESMESKL